MRTDFSRIRVLCIGDVMLDCFVHGTVDRISPEGPVPVLKEEHSLYLPGGVGNVARNIAALGATAVILAVVGNDARGQQLLSTFRGLAGVEADFIVENGRVTTTKTRFVAGSHQLLRVDQEDVAPLSDESTQKLLRRFDEEVQRADIVLISDYAKGCLTDFILRATIETAHRYGRRVVADPKSADFSRYGTVDVIKPNAAELALATRMPTHSDKEVEAAAREALKTSKANAIVVTRAEQGITVLEGDGEARHLRTQIHEVFDVSGAGDTTLAAIGLGLAADLPLVEAARRANIAAGIVVGKAGTAIVHADEFEAALQAHELHRSEQKILVCGKLAETVEAWRRKGLKIAFTNGCFDLLHPGHISLLRQAKERADRLIVGLNSDDSVKRLKGQDRPVQTEMARALVLAALADVDAVTLFSDDTPHALIELVRPDILVKGADYALDQVVGASIVQGYGGEIYLAVLKEGYSTTSTIRSLRAKEAQ
jgi:D-beta-D-heptose 7-phosphate kinase/D-beta-D-heptose 1-phosphate adenosyltransferase